MTRRLITPLLGAALVAAVALGCQPDSITAAREQLGRGSNDTFSILLPIVRDTFFVSKFLPKDDTVTIQGGVIGVRVQSDTLTVDVGEQLKFDNLTFDQFTFSFDQMLTTQTVSTSVSFPTPPQAPAAPAVFAIPFQPRDTISFTTPAGSAVSAATIDTGLVVRTMTNNTTCPAIVNIALLDDTGAAVIAFPANVPILASATLVDTANASGATLSGFVDIETTASFAGPPLCVPSFGSSVASDITFLPMTLASVTLTNVNEGFNETYGALDSEGGIQAVDTVVAASGSMSLTVQNRLPIADTIDITLNGILDASGTPLRDTLVVAAAPGDGTTTQGTLTFDLAGTSIIPGDVQANAVGTAKAATATITPTVATNAVIVDGGLSLVVERIAGTLDPASTPELTVSVEEFTTLTSADVDFEDLEDTIRESTLNLALVGLSVDNDANIPLSLDSLTLGVVKMNAAGTDIQRDGLGMPLYEVDSTTGVPLVIFVADSGQSTLVIPRRGNTTVTVNAAPLVDRMVKLLLDSIDVAFVTVGTVVAGDGTSGSISRTDDVSVGFDVIVGLDFTLPVAGIQFDVNQVSDGVNAEPAQADDLAARVIEAGGTATAENFTPFGIQVAVAIAPDSLADDVDIFLQPNAIFLDTIALSAPNVDSLGVAQGSTSDSIRVTLTGQEARALFDKFFTAGVRITLFAGVGGGGRGAIRTDDKIVVGASVLLQIGRGGR